MNLTSEQVAALAPDAASIKAGRGLTHPAKWPGLGRAEGLVWSECQGSGRTPYQVAVDLDGPACKCTCPSRKFPCKHGLGLLFLAVEQPAVIETGDPPPWAADWRAARRAKAEKTTAASAGKAEKKNRPMDAESAAKRTARRLGQMREGGAELALWLADQVRQGLAAWPQQPAAFFRGIAARMVDAKAPGLAAEIARLETLIRSGDGWPQRVLGQLGRMHLLAEDLRRFETLPTPVQADLRCVLAGAEPIERRLWEEGDADQRAVFLRRLRVTDPAEARRLLEEAFPDDSVKVRATLLPVLAERLGPEDEPFLAAVLANDRGKEVRQIAAALLSRLLASAFARRMTARLDSCIRGERKILRTVTVIEPPDAFAPDWKDEPSSNSRRQA